MVTPAITLAPSLLVMMAVTFAQAKAPSPMQAMVLALSLAPVIALKLQFILA
jgi:hypothetical protein